MSKYMFYLKKVSLTESNIRHAQVSYTLLSVSLGISIAQLQFRVLHFQATLAQPFSNAKTEVGT